MKRFLRSFLVIFILLGTFTYAQKDITVLYLNDTHSCLSPLGPRLEDLSGTQGGIARAATVIGMTKMAGENVLTVHSGDVFMGDLYFNKYFGAMEYGLLKQIGVDAMAVGNHEFDLGPENLYDVLSQGFAEGSIPLLSANAIGLNVAEGIDLGAFIKPYSIQTVGGVKVGIFGLTTHAANMITNPGPVVIEDIFSGEIINLAAIGELVYNLRVTEQCEIVICLSHYGFTADQAIAQYIPGIDLIVGGHDHINIAPLKIGDAYIVQTDGYYKSIGKIQFQVKDGAVTKVYNEVIPLDLNIPEYEPVKQFVDALSSEIEGFWDIPFYSQQIAYADGFFDEYVNKLDKNGNHSTAVGNLTSDAFRNKTGTDIAFEPAGNTSQPIFKGPLVPADLFRVFGYGFNMLNGLGFQLATFKITGYNLYLGIETVLGSGEEDFFPQFSGLKLQYNPKAEAGSRVVSIKINGKPLNPGSEYTVTASEFLVMMLTAMDIPVTDVNILSGYTEFQALMDYTEHLNYYLIPDHEARVVAVGKKMKKDETEEIPAEFILAQNYPNPFNPSTTISYSLPQDSYIKLSIFNVIGEEIDVLTDEFSAAGSYSVKWDAKNLSAGIYLFKLQTDGFSQTRKMILLK